MGSKINVNYADVWNYFHCNREYLIDNMKLIAEFPDYDLKIYLHSDSKQPQFAVYIDSTLEYETFAISKVDCELTVKELYDTYLSESFIYEYIANGIEDCEDEAEDEAEPKAEKDIQKEIYDTIKSREGKLVSAALDFILEAIDNDNEVANKDFWDKLQDCLEHFLRYMSDKHKFKVYRPMFIQDETTKEVVYSEFPYDEYAF